MLEALNPVEVLEVERDPPELVDAEGPRPLDEIEDCELRLTVEVEREEELRALVVELLAADDELPTEPVLDELEELEVDVVGPPEVEAVERLEAVADPTDAEEGVAVVDEPVEAVAEEPDTPDELSEVAVAVSDAELTERGEVVELIDEPLLFEHAAASRTSAVAERRISPPLCRSSPRRRWT